MLDEDEERCRVIRHRQGYKYIYIYTAIEYIKTQRDTLGGLAGNRRRLVIYCLDSVQVDGCERSSRGSFSTDYSHTRWIGPTISETLKQRGSQSHRWIIKNQTDGDQKCNSRSLSYVTTWIQPVVGGKHESNNSRGTRKNGVKPYKTKKKMKTQKKINIKWRIFKKK